MAQDLPQPILVSELFPQILSELLQLLRSLSADEWQKPTACTSWTVKDVALHLLGVELGNLSRRRDDHRLSVSISNWQELVSVINASNQLWVEASQRISTRLLVDLLRFSGEQLSSYFASLDPYAMGSPVSWVGPKPTKIWVDLAREYTERWHHQQHIRDAVGKPGLKEQRYFSPVLQAFMLALPHTYQHVLSADGTTLAVTIMGQAGGNWSITCLGGEWRLYCGRPDYQDASISLDEDLAWRLFTRGVDPETARPQIRFEGDQALGEKILDMVTIIA